LSNLVEFQNQSDPTDFYNGQLPLLAIASGDNQIADAATFLASPLVVRVTNAQGQPLANAPVLFFTGTGALSPDGDGASVTQWLNVRADESGLARVYYRTPFADDPEVETITAQAQSGSNTVTADFIATTDPAHYYEGITPVLTIISGGNQSAVPGYYTSSPLVIEVRDSAGNLLRNAPVTISVSSGFLSLTGNRSDPGSATLVARTDANGRVSAYYMPASNATSPANINVSPTGSSSGSSVSTTATPLGPNGDEDGDGKTNQEESELGTDPLIFNLFSEQSYPGHAEEPHTNANPLPWTFYTEDLEGAPYDWAGLDLTAHVIFDHVGTQNNWVVDDFASINDEEFVRLGRDLIYDVTDQWDDTGANTFTAISDQYGGVYCASYKVILSVPLPVQFKVQEGEINSGFDPRVGSSADGTSNSIPWASVVKGSTRDVVKLVAPHLAGRIRLVVVADSGQPLEVDVDQKDGFDDGDNTLTLIGLTGTDTVSTATIEAHVIDEEGDDNGVAARLHVMALPPRTVSLAIYRVADPQSSPSQTPPTTPSNEAIRIRLNEVFDKPGLNSRWSTPSRLATFRTMTTRLRRSPRTMDWCRKKNLTRLVDWFRGLLLQPA
jgi:hypothetical protein